MRALVEYVGGPCDGDRYEKHYPGEDVPLEDSFAIVPFPTMRTKDDPIEVSQHRYYYGGSFQGLHRFYSEEYLDDDSPIAGTFSAACARINIQTARLCRNLVLEARRVMPQFVRAAEEYPQLWAEEDDLSPDAQSVSFSKMNEEAEREMAEWDEIISRGKSKRD